MQKYLTPLSILFAGLLIAGSFYFVQNSEDVIEEGPILTQEELQTSVSLKKWTSVDGFSVGDPQAPIEMIEYSDYACPFCARFWEQTLSPIKTNYIEKGLVRYTYKDLPVVGGNRASEAAHCAEEQGAFWEYHDVLYSRHSQDRGRWSNPEIHRAYAEFLGLDSDRLVSCFNERHYQQDVADNLSEGQAAGFSGTPSFLVNDEMVLGAKPFQSFQEVIENELSRLESEQKED